MCIGDAAITMAMAKSTRSNICTPAAAVASNRPTPGHLPEGLQASSLLPFHCHLCSLNRALDPYPARPVPLVKVAADLQQRRQPGGLRE